MKQLKKNQKKTEPVVDTSNEIIEKEAPVETIEETKEAPEHEVSCSIREPEPKPKPKAKPKASDIVNCEKCNKSMTYKNLRYSHKCYEEPQPVKPHAKPKAKQKPKPTHEVLSAQRNPKPVPEVYYSDSEEEEQPPAKPFIKKKQPAPQQINPTSALAQHYQLLQQAFIKQKQEKYNNLCQNMFSSKTKKR